MDISQEPQQSDKIVILIDPYKGKKISRYHNLILMGVIDSRIVNEPDSREARSMLAGIKVNKRKL